jgi:multiple antibiotic resistance protein
MTIFSAAFLLILVMNPFGKVPLFLSVFKSIAPERRRKVIVRELLIALAFLILFLFAGRYLLAIIGLSEAVLTVAGGIMLFLMPCGWSFHRWVELLPPMSMLRMAIPCSCHLQPLLWLDLPRWHRSSSFMSSGPSRWLDWLTAVILAWVVTGLILFLPPCWRTCLSGGASRRSSASWAWC